METIQTLLFVLQVLVAVALIGFVLVQHGKGADAGAAFGSGSSSTVFGSQGSGGFMTKVTTVLVAVFLANSLALGYLASKRVKSTPASLLDQPSAAVQQQVEQKTEQATPAVPEENPVQDSDLPDVPVE